MFTEDVIYHLKFEYGGRIVISRDTPAINYVTGMKTSSIQTFVIQYAILLPLDKRDQFLRSLGIQKIGYLEPGEREFLIDKNDLDFDIKLKDTITIESESKYTVSRMPEDAEDYITVTAKELPL